MAKKQRASDKCFLEFHRHTVIHDQGRKWGIDCQHDMSAKTETT